LDHNDIAGSVLAGNRLCESFGRNDWRENHQAQVSAVEEADHHRCQRQVGGEKLSAAAPEPAQSSSQQKGDASAKQWRAKGAQRLRSEIEEVSHGERIVLRMLLQQNRDIGSRRRRLGNENESSGRGEDQNTKPKENRGGNL